MLKLIKIYRPFLRDEIIKYIPAESEFHNDHIATTTKENEIIFKSYEAAIDLKRNAQCIVSPNPESHISILIRYPLQCINYRYLKYNANIAIDKISWFLDEYLLPADGNPGRWVLGAYEIHLMGEDFMSREELLEKKWKIDKNQIRNDLLIDFRNYIIYREVGKKKAFVILYPAVNIKPGLEQRVMEWRKKEYKIEISKKEDFDEYLAKKIEIKKASGEN